LEILGDGRQRKPYLLVEDCLTAMTWGYQRAGLENSKPVDIFNIAVDSTTSAHDIGRMVIEEMGLRDVSITFTGGEQGWPGDQSQVRMSGRKLADLGWHASKSSDDAVREAIGRLLRTELTSVI
jgi:UDP-glucose 4-epimerase